MQLACVRVTRTSPWKFSFQNLQSPPVRLAVSRWLTRPVFCQEELRVFLIAGEPSGDVIGSRIMASLKALCPCAVKFAGVGGVLMERHGLSSEFLMEDLTVMGAVELIPHLYKLRVRLNQTVTVAMNFQPHVVIAIDSKGFSFRVFRQLRTKHVQLQQLCPLNVLYVAPSAWAWKRGDERLKKWVGIVDHILCVLPFEESLCRANGLAATFVGHPVLEDVFHDTDKEKLWASNLQITGDKERFFLEHGLSSGTTLLSLLPGSRMQEVKRMLPIYGKALEILKADKYDLTAVIPTVLSRDLTRTVEGIVKKWNIPVVLIPGASLKEKYEAFTASTAGLCTSGTAVLQMQLARLPCVVAYRANILTELLVKHSIQLKYMSLPNILLDSGVIPEAAFSACTSNNLAQMLGQLFQDEVLRENQISKAQKVLHMLTPRTCSNPTTGSYSCEERVLRPSSVAAKTILSLLGFKLADTS